MECPDCSRYVQGLASAAHFRCHQAGPVFYRICTLCRFQSASLTDALLHCLLNGHSVAFLATIADTSRTQQPRQAKSQLPQLPGEQSVTDAGMPDGEQPTIDDFVSESFVDEDYSDDHAHISTAEQSISAAPVEEVDLAAAREKTCASKTQSTENAFRSFKIELSTMAKTKLVTDFLAEKGVRLGSAEQTPLSKSWSRILLICRKCKATIKPTKNSAKNAASAHLINCLGLKLFACSYCKTQFRRRSGMARHLKYTSFRTCAEKKARLLFVNKEENEKRIREALPLHFPGLSGLGQTPGLESSAPQKQGTVHSEESSQLTVPESLSGGNAAEVESNSEDTKPTFTSEKFTSRFQSSFAAMESASDSERKHEITVDSSLEFDLTGDSETEAEETVNLANKVQRSSAPSEEEEPLVEPQSGGVSGSSSSSQPNCPVPATGAAKTTGTPAAEERTSICCLGCRARLKVWQKGYERHVAAKHILSCLDLKPFMCSVCLAPFRRKSAVAKHWQSPGGAACAEAGPTVLLPDREQNLARIREAVDLYFPGLTASEDASDGHAAKLEVHSEDTEPSSVSEKASFHLRSSFAGNQSGSNTETLEITDDLTADFETEVTTTASSANEEGSDSVENGGPGSQAGFQTSGESPAASLAISAKPPNTASLLTCLKCKAKLKVPRKYQARSVATPHIQSCLGIKPLQCSACRLRFGRRRALQAHWQSAGGAACVQAGATALQPDREQTAQRIRQALALYFPGLNSNATNAADGNETEDKELCVSNDGPAPIAPESGFGSIEDSAETDSPSKAADFSQFSLSVTNRDLKIPVACAKCGSILYCSPDNPSIRQRRQDHAAACHGIKLFACSACGQQFGGRSGVQYHWKAKKSSACLEAKATAVFVDREENERRLKEAVKVCFPDWE